MALFEKEVLTERAGLKFDKRVILDRDQVYSFLEEHSDWFLGISTDLNKNGLQYGTLANGYLYKLNVFQGKIDRVVIVTKVIHLHRVMMRIRYDGTEFAGFQIQSGQRTVQGEIEQVLTEIHDEPSRIAGASRTDAGVHALGQVIHFDTNRHDTPERWMYYFNKRLPKDLIVETSMFTHPLFHSRYDVLKKEYRYRLSLKSYDPLKRNFEWFVGPIDLVRLESELPAIVGTHDFRSFCKGEKDSTVRTIFEAYLENFGDYIELVFVGDGFLRYMIRLMVFALVKISRGDLEATMSELIKEQSRKRTVHLAPAGGLYLSRIDYHD